MSFGKKYGLGFCRDGTIFCVYFSLLRMNDGKAANLRLKSLEKRQNLFIFTMEKRQYIENQL